MITCPCCGSEIVAPPDLSSLASIGTTRHEHSVLEHLMAIYPRAASADALVDEMYRGAREPEGPIYVLRALMPRLRRRIERHGWTIIGGGSGRGRLTLYRLAPL